MYRVLVVDDEKLEREGIRFLLSMEEGEWEIYEAANGKLNIRYDGKVFPCEVFKNNGVEPLSDCEPDNIYEKSIEYIYKDSLYLKKARELVKSHVGCISCEQCVGQYYLGKSMEEDINDK